MFISKINYKAIDTITLAYTAAPISTCLYILLSLVQAILPMAGIALATAHFVDTATAVLQGTATQSDIYIPLTLLLLMLILIKTISSATELFAARIRLKLKQQLNPAMVKKHAALDYKHIENAESWELISRVTRDPSQAVMEGFGGFASFIGLVVSIVSFFMLIFVQIWWAALVILAFSVPMFWLAAWVGKKRYQSLRDSEKFQRRTDYLDEVLTGRENSDERTLFNYGTGVMEDWQQQYEAGRILRLMVTLKTDLIVKASSMTLVAIALLVALTLINPVMAGDLSAGMFMGIVAAVFGMVQELGWQLSRALGQMSQAREYMQDLTAFTALSSLESALDQPDEEPAHFSSLEFRKVRFKYPTGDHYVLDGLSFVLESGKHYAFVGKNGAGKTTVTKLLTGLYTEYEGEILINGKELRTYSVGALKAMFSVIYQDFARYYISLEDNIAIGDIARINKEHRQGQRQKRVEETASLAGLDETIGDLNGGIAAPLGRIKDTGQDISGGQWQRVAIARSLMSRAPVKILDEPTAALDPISESKIYDEFEKMMDGTCEMTIFISHRLGSTKLADEILVIDNGRILERGSHEVLTAAAGVYFEMFESQRGWYQ